MNIPLCLICNDFYFQKSGTMKYYNSSERQTVESDVKHVSRYWPIINACLLTLSTFTLQTSTKK